MDREDDGDASDGAALVLATANPDKAAEIAAILGPVAGRASSVARPADVPDVEETGDTLVDNARLKAIALVEATGLAAVADDTGLEVDALGGRSRGATRPGYSGEHATYADNVAKTPRPNWTGRGHDPGAPSRPGSATVALVGLSRTVSEVWADGVVTGVITRRPGGERRLRLRPGVRARRVRRQDVRPDGSPRRSTRISHRGRAFRALAELLSGRGGSS